MSEPDGVPHLGGASDAELIAAVRGGDLDAYGVLFERHRDAALRLARSLAPGPDADDLVSDAFSKVLNVLRNGGGPDLAFRAYLLTAVRRLHVDRHRVLARATPVGDLEELDRPEELPDTVVAGFENAAAARAFQSLPERWQAVLWHTEVEQLKPAEIAPLLGISANSVSALAYRAREGLRQAFLQMHAADIVDESCVRTRELLGGYVRSGLSRRDSQAVRDHLETCRRCTAVYLELTEVNSSMGALLAPIVLGGAAAAYLSGAGTTAVSATGIGAVVGRVRDGVTSNGPAAAAAGAVVVAGAVAGAFALTSSGTPAHHSPVAAAPAAIAPAAVAAIAPTPPAAPPAAVAPAATPAVVPPVTHVAKPPPKPVIAPAVPAQQAPAPTAAAPPPAAATPPAVTPPPVSPPAIATVTTPVGGVSLPPGGKTPPACTVAGVTVTGGGGLIANPKCIPAVVTGVLGSLASGTPTTTPTPTVPPVTTPPATTPPSPAGGTNNGKHTGQLN